MDLLSMPLWERSLVAGAAIALTALLRAVCGNRLPRRTYVALWDLAIARLLLPFALPFERTPLSMLRDALVSPALMAQTAVRAAPQALPAPAVQAFSEAAVQETLSLPLGRIVYVAVALLLAGHFLRAYRVSLLAFGEALPDASPSVAAALRAFPLRRRVRVCVSGRISAPLSYGVLHPVILLPKGMDRSGDAVLYVMVHELEHIRALDAARKLLLTACVCLHWMNPLVLIMFLLANRDMELLCDARVLARLGRSARRSYALTLLSLEERRSGLSPLVSSFSMTAIEERIIAMKNLKKTSAASALAAALLVMGTGAALAAGTQTTIIGGADGPTAIWLALEPDAAEDDARTEVVISRETYEKQFAQYAPYGLSLDDGRLSYAGKRVRYFEDMYPVGTDGMAGTVMQFPDGEVDVYAVRDLSAPIVRREDGSFDPSGTLTGLREATQAEFDAYTAAMEAPDPESVAVAVESGTVCVGEGTMTSIAATMDGEVISITAEDDAGVADGGKQEIVWIEQATERALDAVVWWTAEEYEAYMEQQRREMEQCVAEGVSGWTNTDGWFVWTQEKMDEAMKLYEQTLADIRNGVKISKTVNGAQDVVVIQKEAGSVTQGEAGAQTAITYSIGK